jgi:hypothetical protein
LVGLEDLDLQILQDRKDVIDLLLVLDGLGQRLVDVVEGQVTLFLREADQVPDLVVDAAGGDRLAGTLSPLRGGGQLCQGVLDRLGGGGIGGGGLGLARHGRRALGGSGGGRLRRAARG